MATKMNLTGDKGDANLQETCNKSLSIPNQNCMNTITTNEQCYDAFKSAILTWKNAHIDEYLKFVEAMNEPRGMMFKKIFKTFVKTVPALKRAWKARQTEERRCDFDDVADMVSGSAYIERLVESVEHADGQKGRSHRQTMLILSWLYFGNSFETMFAQCERIAKMEKAGWMKRHIAAMASRYIVSASIKSGYRTQADWDAVRNEKLAETGDDLLGWSMGDTNATEQKIEEQTSGQTEVLSLLTVPKDQVADACSEYVAQDMSINPIENKEESAATFATPSTFEELLLLEDDNMKENLLVGIRKYLTIHQKGESLALLYLVLYKQHIIAQGTTLSRFHSLLKTFCSNLKIVSARMLQIEHKRLTSVFDVKGQPRFLYEYPMYANEITAIRNQLGLKDAA